ncbi:MAG: D-Ala-D-Ala carboxypeptidase family metallohydrolase [Elusimicrobiales bacterium]
MTRAMLSPHFGFDELTVCCTHPELADKNRLEAGVFITSLQALCKQLLEPVREQFGPVVVLSGFRCEALNAAIGGAHASQHQFGEAADFYVPGVSLDTVFGWIQLNAASLRAPGPGLRYGQAIREPGWIHISLGEPWRDAVKCRQALVFDGKIYRPAV